MAKVSTWESSVLHWREVQNEKPEPVRATAELLLAVAAEQAVFAFTQQLANSCPKQIPKRGAYVEPPHAHRHFLCVLGLREHMSEMRTRGRTPDWSERAESKERCNKERTVVHFDRTHRTLLRHVAAVSAKQIARGACMVEMHSQDGKEQK